MFAAGRVVLLLFSPIRLVRPQRDFHRDAFWVCYSLSRSFSLDEYNIMTTVRARASLRNAEPIDVHEDGIKDEDAEETLDESMDPLEESGHTVDSSDEEVEDAVQEDIARFEESFAGINKRFRLINRIG